MTVMTGSGDQDPDRLRYAFRRFNPVMVGMWRCGLGRVINAWPRRVGRIMVLGHVGRRSGLARWTPLNYAVLDGQLYCTAGFGARTDWYRNVRATPAVQVWLPGGRWAGLGHDVSGHPDRIRILREVLLASGSAAGMAGVDPRRMDDAALARATAAYRLLRIDADPTGPELPAHPRPGDRAWWWLGVVGVVGVVGVAVAVLAGRERTSVARPCPASSRA